MEQQIGRVRRILRHWSGEKSPTSCGVSELERRTSPYAPMNLLLRFATEAGPRTVIASGVPLGHASVIAREMERAGHYAEFVDQIPSLSIAERVKRLKAQKHPAGKRKQAIAVVRVRGIAG